MRQPNEFFNSDYIVNYCWYFEARYWIDLLKTYKIEKNTVRKIQLLLVLVIYVKIQIINIIIDCVLDLQKFTEI